MSQKLHKCSKCQGTGYLIHFAHIFNGVCFQCEGFGTQKTKPSNAKPKWDCFFVQKDGTTREWSTNVRCSRESTALKYATQDYNKRSSYPHFANSIGVDSIFVKPTHN
jgi:hypothetical protein